MLHRVYGKSSTDVRGVRYGCQSTWSYYAVSSTDLALSSYAVSGTDVGLRCGTDVPDGAMH
eukprot:1566193-Rhodomonas_salina.1